MDKNIFLEELRTYKSKNVFNPYLDICPEYDYCNSSVTRLENLSKALDVFLSFRVVDSVWIGRDLGYRGGRRTGIAFTDETHLETASEIWGTKLCKATKGKEFAERTATNIWDFTIKIDEKIFFWNVFPFHPYEGDNHCSNRRHNTNERDIGMKILNMLINLLKPLKIVAIGNDAYDCSHRMFPSINVLKVRHPSYGGEKIFSKQISKLYGL